MTLSVLVGALLFLGTVGYVALAGYVWRFRQAAGARGLTGALLAAGTWSICYGFELASRSVATAEWWSALKYVGVVTLAPALWAFVAGFTGSNRLPRPLLAALLVEPVAVLVLLALPDTRDLVHYYPEPDRQRWLAGSPLSEAGPLFWPHLAYTYVLLMGAAAVLMYRLARLGPPYRKVGAVMIAATTLPFLASLGYNTRVPGIDQVDPAPFMLSVTAVVLVWGCFRLRLLDLLPVARTLVVDQMGDGVVVLDPSGRVIDSNPAARDLLGRDGAALLGTPLAGLVPALPALLERLRPGSPAEGELQLPARGGSGARDLAATLAAVPGPAGSHVATVLVLHDVTRRLRMERQLRDLLREQTMLATTLQAGLRPERLPDLPDVALAARWLPAGPAARVSGDFYDVHQAGSGCWAFVLGDVSGKGVHAAVLTSLARYTVRALSAEGLPPVEVLSRLNTALLERDRHVGHAPDDTAGRADAAPSPWAPDGEERFATVVYGQFARSAGGGVRVRLVLGGHPPPLLRTPDGRVRQIGDAGTVLGLVDPVELTETTLDLAPGELLLAYTDGVTEARHGAEQFGEERLAEVVASAPSAPAAVVSAVVDAVTGYARRRDDVAVLALQAR